MIWVYRSLHATQIDWNWQIEGKKSKISNLLWKSELFSYSELLQCSRRDKFNTFSSIRLHFWKFDWIRYSNDTHVFQWIRFILSKCIESIPISVCRLGQSIQKRKTLVNQLQSTDSIEIDTFAYASLCATHKAYIHKENWFNVCWRTFPRYRSENSKMYCELDKKRWAIFTFKHSPHLLGRKMKSEQKKCWRNQNQNRDHLASRNEKDNKAQKTRWLCVNVRNGRNVCMHSILIVLAIGGWKQPLTCIHTHRHSEFRQLEAKPNTKHLVIRNVPYHQDCCQQ